MLEGGDGAGPARRPHCPNCGTVLGQVREGLTGDELCKLTMVETIDGQGPLVVAHLPRQWKLNTLRNHNSAAAVQSHVYFLDDGGPSQGFGRCLRPLGKGCPGGRMIPVICGVSRRKTLTMHVHMVDADVGMLNR